LHVVLPRNAIQRIKDKLDHVVDISTLARSAEERAEHTEVIGRTWLERPDRLPE